jgi:hypothetical protein
MRLLDDESFGKTFFKMGLLGIICFYVSSIKKISYLFSIILNNLNCIWVPGSHGTH